VLVGPVVLLVAGCAGATAPPPTARVDRGDVVSAVSASGSVVGTSEQRLGFPEGGRVTEVLVRVGDRVEPGQVLARLDSYALRQTLDQKQAALDQQQAVLGRVRGDTTVAGAQASLAQAREIQEATEDEVAATDDANSSATERARTQLDVEEDARDVAQRQLRAARAACASAAPATATAGAPGTTGGTSSAATTCDTSAEESAVQQAESAVVAAKTDVVAAERQEQVDRAAGRVSIENARQGVVSAQNDRASASSDRPYNVAEQQALVDDARAGVAGARRDVEETSLTAPVAGVVAAINGAPGEFVPAPSGVTPQGPGGTPLPPLDDVSGTATEAPETGTFLVLSAANAFEVVVPFEETDAARVVVGQQVDIGLDAVPDAALHGRVLAMAPTGQDLNGIVSFYTTISIEDPIDKLRSGQTAVAKVRTQVAQNVLRVPTTAVGRTDGRPSVTVTGPDGDPVTVPFEPGLVGDDYTEVRSGLQPGQDVRLPQATVTATPDRGGPGDGGPGG